MAAEVGINKERCKGCGLCIAVCPKKNLKLSEELNMYGNKYAVCIDENDCIACCMCTKMCPDWAITIRDKKVKPEKQSNVQS